MSNVYNLLLKIQADAEEIRKANAEMKEMQKSFNSLKTKIDEGFKWKVGESGFDLLVGTFKQIPSYLQASVMAYGRQESAEYNLASAMKSTNVSIEENLEAFKNMASEIQRITTLGDEQIMEFQKLALNMGVNEERMQECIEGAIGLSRAFDIDMRRAIESSAAVIQGKTEKLNELIPALQKCKTNEEKLTLAHNAMRNGFAQAKAETETLRGTLTQLSNAWGDVSEVIGEAVAPVVKEFANLLKSLAEVISENKNLVIFLMRATIALIAAYSITKFQKVINAFKLLKLTKIADTVATVANTKAVVTNTTAQVANAAALTKVANATKLTTSVMAMLNTVIASSSAVLGSVFIAIASVTYAYSTIKNEIKLVEDAQKNFSESLLKHSQERLSKIEAERLTFNKYGATFNQIVEFSEKLNYELEQANNRRMQLIREGLDTKEIDKIINKYLSMNSALWDNVEALEEQKNAFEDGIFKRVAEIDNQRENPQKQKTLSNLSKELSEQHHKLYRMKSDMEYAEGENLQKLVDQYQKESEKFIELQKEYAELKKKADDEHKKKLSSQKASNEKLQVLQAENDFLAKITKASLEGNTAEVERLKTEQKIAQIKSQIVASVRNQFMSQAELKILESDAEKIARAKIRNETAQNKILRDRENLQKRLSTMADYQLRMDIAKLQIQGKFKEAEEMKQASERLEHAKQYAKDTGKSLEEAIADISKLEAYEVQAEKSQKAREEAANAEAEASRISANAEKQKGNASASIGNGRGVSLTMGGRTRSQVSGRANSLFNINTGLRNDGTSMAKIPSPPRSKRSENPSSAIGGNSQIEMRNDQKRREKQTQYMYNQEQKLQKKIIQNTGNTAMNTFAKKNNNTSYQDDYLHT